jgi:hypothetical protein
VFRRDVGPRGQFGAATSHADARRNTTPGRHAQPLAGIARSGIAMRKSSKRILVTAAGLAGLVLLLAAALALRLGANAKPRIEAIASDAVGMAVTVGARPTFSIRRGLHIVLTDVRARRCGADVASAGEVDLGVALLPLLHHEVRIEELRLSALQIGIEGDGDGAAHVDGGCPAGSNIPALAIASVVVSGGSIRYTHQPSGKYLEAIDCEAAVSGLNLAGGDGRTTLKNLALTAKVSCGQVRTHDLTASDVKFTVAGRDGIADLDPVGMRVLGGQGSGKVHADFTGAEPRYQVRYSLTQFRIEDFFRTLALTNVGRGSLDFTAALSLRGTGPDEWLRTLAGDASLRGVDLTLGIGDLDQKFARYESSQNFNLVDVGAVFFLGPIGLGVTKGFDFARILQGGAGNTTFQTLVSEWQLERGVAHAKDVAMATKKNRIALKGGLDFVSGRFADVTVALVDAHGCAQVRQRVSGPFLAPVVEQPSVLKSLTGPTRRLLGRVRTLLGGKCEVFYAGSVAPPT